MEAHQHAHRPAGDEIKSGQVDDDQRRLAGGDAGQFGLETRDIGKPGVATHAHDDLLFGSEGLDVQWLAHKRLRASYPRWRASDNLGFATARYNPRDRFPMILRPQTSRFLKLQQHPTDG